MAAHAACFFTALSNVVLGGAVFAIGHDLRSTLILGVLVYLGTIGARWVFVGRSQLPSFKVALFGLALGVAISAGLYSARVHNHREELSQWYAGLSHSDRQKVRENVRQWMDSQAGEQRDSLLVMAQLTGYENPEDYVVFNYCSPSNKELAAIWERHGLSIARQQ
ncbi:hypothetical protein [Hyphomicrobium sp. MC8b]|uniref:hypothetical protein n=1 Tax=Hyphomicrobium sp. MC8b TaxID=300273 RepID=UPI00391D3339